MEMALTGRVVTAEEAREWGLVNKVVGDAQGEVVDAAVEFAKLIAGNVVCPLLGRNIKLISNR